MELSNYIERHLVKYIQQCLHDGYSPSAIRHALLSKGHHINLIDRSILYLEKKGYRQNIRHHQPKKHDLNQDLFNYMVNLLSRYIKQQLSDGFTLHDIRDALLHYGHSMDVIEHSVKVVNNQAPMPSSPAREFETKAPVKNQIPVVSMPKEKNLIQKDVEKIEESKLGKILSRYTFSISAAFAFIFLIVISIMSDTSFVVVAVAFFPTILSLILIEALYLFFKKVNMYIVIIPIVLAFMLRYVHAAGTFPIIKDIAIYTIMFANLIISLIIVFFYFIGKAEKKV